MSTPNLFSDPGQPASATKSNTWGYFPDKAEVQAWLDSWQSEEQVLDECRRLGLRGKCLSPARCLLAQLCRHRFPACDPRVNQRSIVFFGYLKLEAFLTPSPWKKILERFDNNELPKEFYEA